MTPQPLSGILDSSFFRYAVGRHTQANPRTHVRGFRLFGVSWCKLPGMTTKPQTDPYESEEVTPFIAWVRTAKYLEHNVVRAQERISFARRHNLPEDSIQAAMRALNMCRSELAAHLESWSR